MAPAIGKVERIPLRAVWEHEAHDVSRWLAGNPDQLAEIVGDSLALVEREAAAGDFSVDLLAEDGQGRTVVIENQLGKSNHDHLGKLLTYAAAFEAQVAIWIVGEARSEHAKAVAWLNDSSSIEAHLVRAEAIRIGDSAPALLLTPIIGPTEQAKMVARAKQEQSEQHGQHKQFWTELLAAAARRTALHSGVSPAEQQWLSTSAGRAGLSLGYVIRRSDWRVELFIGAGDKDENKRLFDLLAEQRHSVERAFGGAVEWQRLDEGKGSRITTPWQPGGSAAAISERPKIHSAMVDAMMRLEAALRGPIAGLPPKGRLQPAVPSHLQVNAE